MPNPAQLYALAHDALAAAEEAIQGLLPPEYHHVRVHVVNGPPAMDGWVEAQGCIEHLVSWVEGVMPTTEPLFPQPVPGVIPCATLIGAVTVAVQVVRCEPTIYVEGDGPMARAIFPEAAALDDAARIVLVESWAMWQGLARWANELGASDDDLDVVLGPLTPVPPQGGIAGMEARITVATSPGCNDPEAEGITWAPPLPDDFLPATPED